MSAISTFLKHSDETAGHLRQLDPQRDLLQVADLIELCFSDTLDRDGFDYLRQVRAMARSSPVLTWMYNLAEQAGNMPMSGFVWEEDGRIVGNISLIPIQLSGDQRGLLIANVAVHPDYRGRGIAQALTKRSVEQARQRRADRVWLQVRAENAPAVHVYSKLGFRERARRTTWAAGRELPPMAYRSSIRVGDRRPRDWSLQQTWLDAWFPPEIRWQLTYNPSMLRPGLTASLYRFFSFQFVRTWAVERSNQLQGVLAWLEDEERLDNLLLAAPQNGLADADALLDLLIHARRSIDRSTPLSLNAPADFLPEIFPKAGFFVRQTLIWMDIPVFSP